MRYSYIVEYEYCFVDERILFLFVDGDYCKYSIETANLQVYGGFYNDATVFSFSLILLMFSCLSTIVTHRKLWKW